MNDCKNSAYCPGEGFDLFHECQCRDDKELNQKLWERKRSVKILKYMLTTNVISFSEWCKNANVEMDHDQPNPENFIFYCHDLMFLYGSLERAVRQGAMDVDLSYLGGEFTRTRARVGAPGNQYDD